MKKKFQLFFIFVLILLTYSCENSTEPNIENEDNEIREIVFRDKFQNNYSGHFNYNDYIDTSYSFYFLAIYDSVDSNYNFMGRHDPDDELISRFIGFAKIVKKFSECHFDNVNAPTKVIDNETGKEGMLFYTGPIKWISKTEAEVEGGYWEGFSSSDCFTYRLYKYDGQWFIYYKTPRWAS